MLISDDPESDLEVDFIALVDRPAIKKDFVKFNEDEKSEYAVDVPHYTKDGKLYTGPTHLDSSGRLMSGAVHSDESVYLYHESELSQMDRKKFAIQDEEKQIISGVLMIANQRIYRNDPELGEYEVYFSPETIKKIAIKLAKKGFHNNVNLMHNSDMKVPGVTLFEIFQSDKERGIRPMKGFEDLADGSLFGSMYVENPVAWQWIKDGLVKGFSVEGNFGMTKKDKYDEQFKKIVQILNSTMF